MTSKANVNSPSTDKASTRTAIEGSATTVTAARKENEKEGSNLRSTIDSIWINILWLVMHIVRACHSVVEVLSDVIVKIYRIILFCWRKPRHAKELVLTTIHLIRVSYDAEIWSWTDICAVLKSHLIQPMTKNPSPEVETGKKTK